MNPLIEQAVALVADYERLRKDNDKLKELYEDSRKEIKSLHSDLKETMDLNTSLKKRVKDLDCEVFVLGSHRDLNAKAKKRTEHYTKLMTAKDREIDTLRDEVAYLESKVANLMDDKVEITQHFINREEWVV
jgi:cell division protein FtsB